MTPVQPLELGLRGATSNVASVLPGELKTVSANKIYASQFQLLL